MKAILCSLSFLIAVSVAPLGIAATPAKAKNASPTIESVSRRAVKVKVPAGYESVTLEQCTSISRRTWKKIATKTTARTAGMVEFQLDRAVSRGFLRVNGRVAALLAGDMKTGPSIFLADPALTRHGPFSNHAAGLRPPTSAGNSALTDSAGADSTRTVSESDIWRLAGDRLYFFNGTRGLQVLDISNPDDPALLGQLRAPGVGEQMYLVDAAHVALLTSYGNAIALPVARAALSANDSTSGTVFLVDVATGKPKTVGTVTYRGSLRESRLVGSVLYVVSQVWDAAQSGLEVASFDLSDPVHPVARDTLFLGSWGGVVQATDRFLFVVRDSSDWSRSTIEIIDISSPTGVLAKRGSIATAGQVNDKFKLHLEGNIFTAVSAVPARWQDIGNEEGDAKDRPAEASRTKVETFSLANPQAPAALGSLEIGAGETVRATRFDGQRLYVVTFFSVDPLWVVDLSRPAQPTLLGELKVPGFSSYIEPLGDRLVAVGSVASQVAVSLFDVSDPTHPALLSQLPLGGDGGYSYSEANWDEKALSVLPAENLILVPYSGYDSGSGFAERVQLIDLNRDSLTPRGVIDHGIATRRTAVKGNRILAISTSDLVTVDFSDRDKPRITSDVEIAWRVDRVFLAGEHLVQLGGATGWRHAAAPTLTVSTAADPDSALSTFDLEDKQPVIAASVRDGRLYVAQQDGNSWGWGGPLVAANIKSPIAENDPPSVLILSVFDLTKLPALERIGHVTTDATLGLSFGGDVQAVWPSAGVLVLVRPQQSFIYFFCAPLLSGGVVNATNDLVGRATPTTATFTSLNISGGSLRIAAPSSPWPWYGGGSGTEAVAFDVSVPSAPVVASKIESIRNTRDGEWSAAFADGGKVYVSAVSYGDPSAAKSEGSTPREFRHFLKVVDFADPIHPSVGADINIPGKLIGLLRGATLLYTAGPAYDAENKPKDGRAIHVSGFDGTAAHFGDQIALTNDYDPYALDGETVLIGSQPAWSETTPPTGHLQAWQLGGDGKFQLAGEIAATTTYTLTALHGLLISGYGDGQHLYDVSDPTHIVDRGDFPTVGWSGSLTHADGNAARGLWEPLGEFGVSFVEFGK